MGGGERKGERTRVRGEEAETEKPARPENGAEKLGATANRRRSNAPVTGAAGRAAESDETNENVEPVAAAAPPAVPVAKADPPAVAEDSTCLDELD